MGFVNRRLADPSIDRFDPVFAFVLGSIGAFLDFARPFVEFISDLLWYGRIGECLLHIHEGPLGVYLFLPVPFGQKTDLATVNSPLKKSSAS